MHIKKQTLKYALFLLVGLILLPVLPLAIAMFISYKVYKSGVQKRWLVISAVILLTLFALPSWINLFPDANDIKESTQDNQTSVAPLNIANEPQEQQAESNIVENKEEKPEYEKALVLRVVDGDTIELEGGQKVRYIGMDTPELTSSVDCYAEEASNKNRELVEGKEVEMEKDVSETDQYGRLLRYVYIDGQMVNESLVSEGYARVATYPPDAKNKDLFLAAEQDARDNRRGLWGDACACEGETLSTVCTSCNLSTITMQRFDCSTYEQTKDDSSCAYLCPVPKPESVYVPPVVTTPQQPSSSYVCNCKKTCPQMSSCEEAQYQLNVCGCSQRDADHDGVACDADCQ